MGVQETSCSSHGEYVEDPKIVLPMQVENSTHVDEDRLAMVLPCEANSGALKEASVWLVCLQIYLRYKPTATGNKSGPGPSRRVICSSITLSVMGADSNSSHRSRAIYSRALRTMSTVAPSRWQRADGGVALLDSRRPSIWVHYSAAIAIFSAVLPKPSARSCRPRAPQ